MDCVRAYDLFDKKNNTIFKKTAARKSLKTVPKKKKTGRFLPTSIQARIIRKLCLSIRIFLFRTTELNISKRLLQVNCVPAVTGDRLCV